MTQELDAKRVLYALDAGWVQRYHGYRLLWSENVAAHSWGVATLIAMLHPNPSVNLLKAALFHDLEEKITGDMTPMAKQRFPLLAKELDAAEACIRMEHNLFVGITPEDKKWLDAADMFHAWWTMYHEVMCGNRVLAPDLSRVTKKMIKLWQENKMPLQFEEVMNQVEEKYPDVLDIFGDSLFLRPRLG